MKRIKKLVDDIKDELCSAKEYSETYLDFKAKGNSAWANKYKEMALQELNHAMNIHDYAVQEITELRKVYTPPTKMEKKWDEEHAEYIEKTSWIKMMLNM